MMAGSKGLDTPRTARRSFRPSYDPETFGRLSERFARFLGTGKSNYEHFARDLNMTLDDAAQYLSTPEGACMSAGWFWHTNHLNTFANRGDVLGCTKRINGGTIGLADRQAHYQEALHIFGG